MGRTEISIKELERVEVLARVRSKQLRVVYAAPLLGRPFRVVAGPRLRVSARVLCHKVLGGEPASRRRSPFYCWFQ